MRATDTSAKRTPSYLASVLFLGSAVILGFTFACGGPPSSTREQAATESGGLPELTDEIIHERINDARVRDVPEENGTADPISWGFYQSEPKEITVVDKQVNGGQATIILDIKTRSAPGTRNPRELAGQIRTEWRLETGWVLRRWEIVRTENISMKYKNLPKQPEQNSNR